MQADVLLKRFLLDNVRESCNPFNVRPAGLPTADLHNRESRDRHRYESKDTHSFVIHR
jgi:hypothetical protein